MWNVNFVNILVNFCRPLGTRRPQRLLLFFITSLKQEFAKKPHKTSFKYIILVPLNVHLRKDYYQQIYYLIQRILVTTFLYSPWKKKTSGLSFTFICYSEVCHSQHYITSVINIKSIDIIFSIIGEIKKSYKIGFQSVQYLHSTRIFHHWSITHKILTPALPKFTLPNIPCSILLTWYMKNNILWNKLL